MAVSYTYDADGLRTTKQVGSTLHEYEYVGDQLVYEKRAIKYKENRFLYKNRSLVLSENGKGGYYTGYDLLNGSNADYGGFYVSGKITKQTNKKRYKVQVTFIFNDFMDSNPNYRNDLIMEQRLRWFVLKESEGVNYQIKIRCKKTFYIKW